MNKINNPHAKRLYNSLLNFTDEQTAQLITDKIHLTKTPNETKKLDWAKNICSELTEKFDDETVKKIRMDCACGPGKSTLEQMKKIYDSATDLNDFAERYNKLGHSHKIRLEGDVMYFNYPICYCPMVKRIDIPKSKVWCYCTLGYSKKLFSYALGCEVDVELLESIKNGDSRCLMRIVRIKQ